MLLKDPHREAPRRTTHSPVGGGVRPIPKGNQRKAPLRDRPLFGRVFEEEWWFLALTRSDFTPGVGLLAFAPLSVISFRPCSTRFDVAACCFWARRMSASE